MGNVVFEDFRIQCKRAIDDSINIALEECAGEIESAAKRNSRVDTGQTKNSFKHVVDDSTHTAYIGSDYENAIWEEFGTGEYALNGNGRKGGWWYKNPKATWNKDGSLRKNSKRAGFVFTLGKRPSRALWNAFNDKRKAVVSKIENSLKGM